MSAIILQIGIIGKVCDSLAVLFEQCKFLRCCTALNKIFLLNYTNAWQDRIIFYHQKFFPLQIRTHSLASWPWGWWRSSRRGQRGRPRSAKRRDSGRDDPIWVKAEKILNRWWSRETDNIFLERTFVHWRTQFFISNASEVKLERDQFKLNIFLWIWKETPTNQTVPSNVGPNILRHHASLGLKTIKRLFLADSLRTRSAVGYLLDWCLPALV